MFHQVALLEVHNSRMLRQEHTLLEAYPSLRDDLIAAAKTVAPDAEEVLKKLSSAFFSRPLPGMNSPHLNFWRTPDQVGAKSWQIVTDVEQLYPSIRGTPLAEEYAEEGADEDPETNTSGEPDISAKFHFRRDFFKQWKTAQTVLQFDVIFDSKCTPFVPGVPISHIGRQYDGRNVPRGSMEPAETGGV
ncbi:hypothetical protein QFC24_007070 [Naganishia onofrii]|uniref:Uncharacterized protein n=1 Tax=Naganishia onofrii TaxID=1851511 RepID=A0ACC2WVK8_9TREE|nr:hypothetical protein QFC24_007070 [Naganishia onofrii]